MDKLKEFFISLLLFIGFSAIGTAIGYNIGKTQAKLNSEGKFSTWRVLESYVKFNKLVDATPETIWAQSSDGKLYSYSYNRCNDKPECHQWIDAIEVPSSAHEFYEKPEISAVCPPIDLKYFTNPPGNVVECTKVRTLGMDVFVPAITDYFALLDTGQIWTWEFNYSPIDDVVRTLLCTGPGFALGVAAFIVFMTYLKRKRTNQNTSESSTK